MTCKAATNLALAYFDDEESGFWADLARRVAIPTECQRPECRPELYRYLENEMQPGFEAMGYICSVYDNPIDGMGPVLLAHRHESDDLPTILGYGHGDVVRGYDDQWRDGIGPWEMKKEGDRWYGRGTADNKYGLTNLVQTFIRLKKEGFAPTRDIVLVLSGDEETGMVAAVDTPDGEEVARQIDAKGWGLDLILNTHWHADHTGGNQAMIKATGAKLLAHKNARDRIPGVNVGLEAGNIIHIGKSVELECLDTPGHTMSHVCLLSHSNTPALFCGDTLFNAGAGNCHSGGHPAELYQTFTGQLAVLPEETLIYPGHDYIANNLEFTLDREPDNNAAKALLADVANQNPDDPLVSTLAIEKEVNTFFRLHNPSVTARLRESFPDLPAELDAKTVFVKLRELRNSW